ncbi:hypothetical protein BZA77DRAFT_300146 [Pyronema omphalodes]|nr:hypothetical protein BZA77DRAFT_300146 [Pyronema omphalodes]
MSQPNRIQPPSVFNQALSRFKLSLTPKEVDNFQFTSLQDVERTIVDIQKKQAATKTLRNMNRLRPFITAMEQYGKVIEVFVNASSFVAFVWGPLKFILQAAGNVLNAFDTILDAYETLGDTIPLLLQYQSLFCQPLMQKVLGVIFEDILEFHREAVKIFKRQGISILFASMWKDFKARFQKISDSLERHSRLIECHASLLEYQAAQDSRRQAELNFDERRKDERKQQMVSVTEWLMPTDMKNDQERYTTIRKLYPSTCTWIFEQQDVIKWRNSSHREDSTFWLYGIPGSGKTILASAIIENLQQKPDATICFAFCKYGDTTRNNFHCIARTFLAQLLRQNSELLPYIYNMQAESFEIRLSSGKTLEDLLDVAFKNSGETYIIIDGLDEFEQSERRKTFAWIKTILGATSTGSTPPLKIMVLSTDEKDIKKNLLKTLKKRIEGGDVQKDIKSYLESRFVEVAQKFKISDSAFLIRDIAQRANGMFLFAHLVVENLLAQPTKAQFEHELKPNIFPQGLGQAYDRIVNRIYNNTNAAQRSQAECILGWVVCAKRPLKWLEIQGALAIDLERGIVDFEGRCLRDDIKDLCGCLIGIQDDTLELVHTTAKFHLTQQKLVTISVEEMKLATLCARYLGLEYFRHDLSEITLQSYISSGHYAFMDYAVVHWLGHVEACSSVSNEYTAEDFENLVRWVDQVLKQHWREPTKNITVSEDIKQRFAVFDHTYMDCEKLRQLASVKDRGLTEHGILLLGSFVPRMRSDLEKLESGSSANVLVTYYGEKIFKCKLSYCRRFYHGFSSIQQRELHHDEHERPFKCPHIVCLHAHIGYPSKPGLNEHIRQQHFASSQDGIQFVDALHEGPVLETPFENANASDQKMNSAVGAPVDGLIQHNSGDDSKAYVLQKLRTSHSPVGCQTQIDINERAQFIVDIESSLRFVRPQIGQLHAINMAITFEYSVLEKAKDTDDYRIQCSQMPLDIHEHRALRHEDAHRQLDASKEDRGLHPQIADSSRAHPGRRKE